MPEQHKKTFHYFVDGRKFDAETPTVTGTRIRAEAGIDPNYQIFLEEHGDNPDTQVQDATVVDLTHGAKHLYSVPPATFGQP